MTDGVEPARSPDPTAVPTPAGPEVAVVIDEVSPTHSGDLAIVLPRPPRWPEA